jgi:general secretion pathway protein J
VPKRAERGFTLLEVLMALVLLALLLSLAWASMRAAIQSSRAGEALIARTEQSRTVQTFLRRQLSQAMPIAYEQLADQGRERRFEGSADELVFVAPMPGYLSRGGAHVQTLSFVGSGRGQRLEFNFAQLNGYDPDNPEFGAEPVVLIDGISRGRFEFRELDENGELRDWNSDWETSERLPLMVRLVLEFDREDPRHWPSFDVTVMAAASGIQPVGFNQRRQRGLTIPNSGARPPRPAGRP